MTAYWQTCDVFDGLAQLESGSIDLVVTSPPFLALRSYLPADHPDKAKEIGSEATPAAFLDVMLRFTAELRRVVAPHGSICVELGDTYAGSGGAGGDYLQGGWREDQRPFDGSMKHARIHNPDKGPPIQNKNGRMLGGGQGWPLAKSKTLIPELYRIALAYGINPLTGTESPAGRWRVRNVVTWCRPNPPVGALGDKWRPATSDVVVACTSDKRFWDDLATRTTPKAKPQRFLSETGYGRGGDGTSYQDGARQLHTEPTNRTALGGSPLLDYWVIPPTGYAGAHYAVYPQELVVPLVKAMGPPFVCLDCGVALRWEHDKTGSTESLRMVRLGDSPGVGEVAGGREEPAVLLGDVSQSSHSIEAAGVATRQQGLHLGMGAGESNGGEGRLRHAASADGVGPDRQATSSLGSSPSRQRDQGRQSDRESGTVDQDPTRPAAEARPNVTSLPVVRQPDSDSPQCSSCEGRNLRRGRVLDPFAGSGTTLAVAQGHGLDALGFDLDPRNEELARERVGPMFFQPWKEAP